MKSFFIYLLKLKKILLWLLIIYILILWICWKNKWLSFLSNFSAGYFCILITIVVIDYLAEQRDQKNRNKIMDVSKGVIAHFISLSENLLQRLFSLDQREIKGSLVHFKNKDNLLKIVRDDVFFTTKIIDVIPLYSSKTKRVEINKQYLERNQFLGIVIKYISRNCDDIITRYGPYLGTEVYGNIVAIHELANRDVLRMGTIGNSFDIQWECAVSLLADIAGELDLLKDRISNF